MNGKSALELFYELMGKGNPFAKLFSMAQALLTGENVSEERLRRRLEICTGCPHIKRKVVDGTAIPYSCGICGCVVKGDKSLINLARYEETDAYGCPHPAGSRWKADGV